MFCYQMYRFFFISSHDCIHNHVMTYLRRHYIYIIDHGFHATFGEFFHFFFQVLFVGGAGGILVQTTLAGLGYEVSLIDLAAIEIPVALFSLVVSCVYVIVKDNRISKKYYGKSAGKKAQK